MKILLFGQLTDIAGSSSMEITGINNSDELKERLANTFPTLKNLNYVIAINKEIIHKKTNLKEEDTIALLPPFSGG